MKAGKVGIQALACWGGEGHAKARTPTYGCGLKTQLQAQGERSAARQFVVKIQRVEIVILIGDVEQAERDLGFSMQKSITDKRIELPEVIAWFCGLVAFVALRLPERFSSGKETAGMIVNRRQTQLMQNPLGPLTWYNWVINT